MELGKQISLCGTVDLLAAIFGEDKEELRKRYRLPYSRPYTSCLNCRRLIPFVPSVKRKYCSYKCRSEYTTIQIACDECGKLFRRYQSSIIYKLNYPHPPNNKIQKRFFCSRQCWGKYAGEHYGLRAPPENAGRKRKWDWEQVYQLRKEKKAWQ